MPIENTLACSAADRGQTAVKVLAGVSEMGQRASLAQSIGGPILPVYGWLAIGLKTGSV